MTTHEVLVAARNLIDREGLCHGGYGGPGRGYCIAGAITTVLHGAPRMISTDDAANAAVFAIVPRGEAYDEWNDRRTKDEVLAAFDKAIAETAPEPADPFGVRETKAVFA